MKRGNQVLLTVFSMVLISFLCLFVSQSYSYVLGSTASTNNQVISTGNLNSNVTHTVLDSEFSALSDEDGLSQSEYGRVDITKNNQYSIYYSINLSYSVNSLQSGETTADFLPMEYIRVALFEMNGNNVSSTPVVGPISMADLTIFSADTSNVFNNKYSLTFGTFNTGSDSKSYALKVWADENTPDDYDNYLLNLTLDVYQEPLVSKQVYNLFGFVYDDGDEVSGATISLQNGTKTVTSSSDGSFTLSDVPEGTYNLKITSGNIVKDTTIRVVGGTEFSVTSTNPSNGASGSYIQNSAYTYYTTPYKILSANSLTTTSSQVATTSYTIPKAYIIMGTQAVDTLYFYSLIIDISSTDMLHREEIYPLGPNVGPM